MPGGYGTAGPWGSAGTSYVTPGQSSSPYQPGGGSTNQGNVHGQTSIPSVDTIVNTDITDTVTPLTEQEKIWKLATQAAASNPGYEKSWKGQQLIEQGITPGSDAWIQEFGLPHIISTGTYQGNYDDKWSSAIKTTPEYDDEGNLIFGDKFVYSGQGKHLMDQYDDPTGTYQEQVDDYYKMREEEMAQQTGNNYSYGYSNPGYNTVAGGYGYGYGDPVNIGKTPWDYGDPYSEARYASDPMMKFMVDAHSPMYAARGGIMNLRR